MKKLAKGILITSIVAVLMFSVASSSTYATTPPKTEKNDTNSIINEFKAKTVNYKITWNANRGKIGTKKTISTTVKKGSKLNKFVTTPKRTGYTFKGWYTKKSGGKKITKNTVVKNKVTYYAKWTKGNSGNSNRVLSAEEKKFVGAWINNNYGISSVIMFSNSGTFAFSIIAPTSKYGSYGESRYYGDYSVKNGKIYFTNVIGALKTSNNPKPPFIFSKNDYTRVSGNNNAICKWCDEHSNCLIITDSSLMMIHEDTHFTKTGTGDYSWLKSSFF